MKSFKGIGKNIMDAAVDGATLYAGKKGFQIVNTMAARVAPASIDVNVRTLGVAAIVAGLADMVLPTRYARLAGAVAAEQAIESFVGPTVDSALLKSGMIAGGDVSVKTAAALTAPAATAGYAQNMNGYATQRGMSGYARMSGVFPTVNSLGLPG